MKPMVWKPEEKDTQVNEYLDRTNHAPYEFIFGSLIVLLCLFTLILLAGIF